MQQLSHESNMDLMRTFRTHIAQYGVEEGSQDSGTDLGSGVAVKIKYTEKQLLFARPLLCLKGSSGILSTTGVDQQGDHAAV